MSIWKGRISVSLDMSLNLRELADDEDGQPGRPDDRRPDVRADSVRPTIADRAEVSRQ
jgi:hypothetical protein